MFKKILIANRGEIALRIVRACREMGLRSAAVFSDADRKSLHVLHADEAVPIGPSPAKESYLSIEKILDAARRVGADAIHPGYGFLSENPQFARACNAAGVAFIGPSAAAMELMGSKTQARETAIRCGVPIVPGTERAAEQLDEALAAAAICGYPVMLKAAAGGGGRGMRRVDRAEELPSAFRDAGSEAENAFGDGSIYVEKYLDRPRHIEFQILGDPRGNLIHLGERECSIQRRHQKIVEECPSPAIGPDLRARMGADAIKIASAAGYSNAGTVEFLVDAAGHYYFLEVNARLQVEHPVTEMVTGLDLVQWQIRIAAGEPLTLRQSDISMNGSAIECRIYAEDPQNGFFPCSGPILSLDYPSGPGVRIDGGIYAGWQVPVEYDPLLAKLVVWGGDRRAALARLKRALDECAVGGIQTNISLFKSLLGDPGFVTGQMDTGLVARLLETESRKSSPDGPRLSEMEQIAMIAACIHQDRQEREQMARRTPQQVQPNRWKTQGRNDLLRGNSEWRKR